MNLDEMYQECSMYTDETITKTGADYANDSLKIVNKFKSGINYAYKKIARERYKLDYTEDVVLDSNKQFDLTTLTNTFYQIKDIRVGTTPVSAFLQTGNKVECPNNAEGDTITISYYYIPAELTSLTDSPVIPEGTVDPKIYCFYGAYTFLIMEGTQEATFKAQTWLNLFNDGFNSIIDNKGEIVTTQTAFGMEV